MTITKDVILGSIKSGSDPAVGLARVDDCVCVKSPARLLGSHRRLKETSIAVESSSAGGILG